MTVKTVNRLSIIFVFSFTTFFNAFMNLDHTVWSRYFKRLNTFSGQTAHPFQFYSLSKGPYSIRKNKYPFEIALLIGNPSLNLVKLSPFDEMPQEYVRVSFSFKDRTRVLSVMPFYCNELSEGQTVCYRKVI